VEVGFTIPEGSSCLLAVIAVCFARLYSAKMIGTSLSYTMTCARRDLNHSKASIAITKLSDTSE